MIAPGPARGGNDANRWLRTIEARLGGMPRAWTGGRKGAEKTSALGKI